MKPTTFVACVIGGVLVLGLIWFFVHDRIGKQGSEVEDTETEVGVIRLDADVYPLYPKATWEQTEVTEGGETSIVSKPFADVTNIGIVSTPFTEYYHEKLTKTGWEPDMMREASGPGSNVSYYVKGDRFITIGYRSDFNVQPEDAPAECPCNVHLLITSGVE